MLLALTGSGSAQTSSQLLTVSKPPASLLPTDPPQGLIFTSPPDLPSAEVFFSTDGGPVDLGYLAFDGRGNGYLTFDDSPDETAPGGVMIVPDLQGRQGQTFDPGRDRLITGSATGLREPKDLVLAEGLGLLIVADFGGANLKAFDALRPGNVAPVFVTTDLGSSGAEPRRPWGVAYDEPADRLFVGATDGTLLVYDGFLERQGDSGPDRVIIPILGGERVSYNLHDLAYLSATDTVIVTDVGAATTSDQAGFDTDGSLLVLEGASRAAGPTPVRLRVHGPASLLGNPVGLAHEGEDVFVAENALDLVLRFDGLLARRGDLELAPDAAVSVVKPESVFFARPVRWHVSGQLHPNVRGPRFLGWRKTSHPGKVDCMNGPTQKMRRGYLGVVLALGLTLTACGDLADGTGGAQAPEIGVTGPFTLSGDGSYTGAVAENRLDVVGTQNGFVERLRYKLNEAEWLDANLSETAFNFSVEGLQAGSNTIALRLDGVGGQVGVDVIVVDATTGETEAIPDPDGRELVALTDGNKLTFFNSSTPGETDTLLVEGLQGTLLGFDFRPANGLLYALSSTNTLYTVDTGSGVATEVSTLSESFTGRARSGVDFNPVADRLRITGSSGQNFRVNVDTGEVTLDGDLAFVEGDTNESLQQNVTASAYTNSTATTPETTALYNLDTSLNALLLQDPPNDGGLATVGAFGADVSAVAGFDIASGDDGSNVAYAASGGQLYTVDLESGAATLRGLIDDGEGDYQGLAVVMTPRGDNGGETPVPTPDPNPRGLVALGDDNTLVRFNSANPENGNVWQAKGVDGTLLGIDVRPATGGLYGLSDANKLYTINLSTRRATEVSTLSEPFEAGALSGVDFNPVADRLRITGSNGQNFRVNVDTGEVTLDGELAFAEGDANAAATPAVTASAYTNSTRETPTATELYNLDATLDVLLEQNPPNDGTLLSVGRVGFDVAEVAGFDIAAGDDGSNTGYALSGSSLYLVDPETGTSTLIGTLPEGIYRGLAVDATDR